MEFSTIASRMNLSKVEDGDTNLISVSRYEIALLLLAIVLIWMIDLHLLSTRCYRTFKF